MLKKLRLHPFVADVASLLGSRITTMVLGILGSVVLARFLGPSDKGLVTTILVVPGMVMSFADLGLRQATTYYLGKRIHNDQAVISTLVLLSVLTSALGIVITLIAYVLTGLPQRYGWAVIVLALLTIPLTLCSTYGRGVLLGKQRIHELAIAGVLEAAAYLILLVPLIWTGPFQVEGALLATLLSQLAGASYVAAQVRRYGVLHARYIPGLPWEFFKRGYVYALALFVLGLNYRLDIIILERLSTTGEVGIFSVGVSLAQMLWLLPAALTMVNFGRSAAATDSYAHAQKTAMVMRVTLVGALLPCLGLYFLAPWIIPLIYGATFVKSGLVVQSILPGIWAALAFKILNSDLAGRGQPLAALWVYGAAVVLNVGLNLLWIPKHGAIGAGWASSVSYCIGAMVFATAYARLSRLPLAVLFLPTRSDFRWPLPTPSPKLYRPNVSTSLKTKSAKTETRNI